MNKKNRMIVCIGMLAAVVAAGTALAGGFASLMDENPHFTPRQVVDWKARADKGDGVADARIGEILTAARALPSASKQLGDEIVRNGAPDNYTFLIVETGGAI